MGKNYLENIRESMSIDTFAGAKPRFLDRGKNRRSASTLSIPELQTVESNGLIWKINANVRGETS